MMKINWRLTLLLITFALSGCQVSPRESEVSGKAQGTTYHIKLVLDGASTSLEEIQGQVTATLAGIDAKLSNYQDDSEISLINQQENTDWLAVSQEITELLVIAHTVYERSDGCYDLTVKPLFDLWGFSRHENRIPAQDEINALLPHLGMSLLEVDAVNQRIRKKDPKLKIDLSSIAQGYSVGMVARRLEEMGIKSYMVEIGGEMMVKGRKANGDAWRVGIETPTPFIRKLHKVINVKEHDSTAIMTAGTYRNFFEENGQAYSHILNPKTGRPVIHHLHSVTVMHDDPTWADAWDTALLCVGEQEAARIAEAEKLKVFLIYDDGNKLKEHMSKAFAASQ
ncbi:FAD:protein FMN transferase [Methyloglobulus sp.]|uniref:FAD:protein FMN transferase n=1 Tax=Methyloglobulus sp. TaxID=2518622 RepID=UPI0039896070